VTEALTRIDLVSNHVAFKEQEHYRALLRGQDLPAETFSGFIHEATHHWCNTSPVVSALAFLYLSVAREALHWLTTGDDSRMDQTLEDLATYEMAVSWMRPLMEGLAQFAEYDVLPDFFEPPQLLSPPLDAAMRHLFHLPRRIASLPDARLAPIFHELADEISAWRLSRQTIDRKSDLLLQPIGSQGSAYLLGYLAVKQLWRNAQRFYAELAHADTFMIFLRKLVFGDFVLISELLDRSQDARQRGLGFGRRLHERLNDIRLMPWDDEVLWSTWEELLMPPQTVGRGGFVLTDAEPFAALDTTELVQQGMRRFHEQFVAAIEPLDLPPGELRSALPADSIGHVLRERYLMWLGDSPASWVSTGRNRGRVLMGRDVVLDDVQLTNASDEGLDALRLDSYLDLYEGYRLTTMAGEKGVFGFAFDSAPSERARSELTRSRLDRHRIAGLIDVLHGLVSNYAVGTNFRELVQIFWGKDGRALLDATYLGFAFDFDDAARDAVALEGLDSIMGNDPDLVRSVAAITLAASARMSPERLCAVSDGLAVGPAEAVERINASWPSGHVPLAAVNADGFLQSAF
jgi:hypothetical protein